MTYNEIAKEIHNKVEEIHEKLHFGEEVDEVYLQHLYRLRDEIEANRERFYELTF